MKQLLVDSMICFSFDRPVTVNCPILVIKKMKTIKNITFVLEASNCTLLILTRNANNFKLYFLNE